MYTKQTVCRLDKWVLIVFMLYSNLRAISSLSNLFGWNHISMLLDHDTEDNTCIKFLVTEWEEFGGKLRCILESLGDSENDHIKGRDSYRKQICVTTLRKIYFNEEMKKYQSKAQKTVYVT